MGQNGPMLSGKARRRRQRITVGVIIGALVISLALSLLSVAVAAPLTDGSHRVPAGLHAAARADTGSPTPAVTDSPLIGSSDAPKPVTKTPQGQATQVTDEEHIGGLIGFIAFMLGGILLLVRGRRRDRRERRSASAASILS
jgi:hypothetical protein